MGVGVRGSRGLVRLAVALIVTATVVFVPPPENAAAAEAGTVSLVSHTPVNAATTPVGTSSFSAISANGAFVVFESDAPNLVAGQSDNNSDRDIFLLDRITGEVKLVSHTPGSATTAVAQSSSNPSISADGAFVAFRSSANNLVAGQIDSATNTSYDIFLYERATGTVTLASHTPTSPVTAVGAQTQSPSISADGSVVTFISTSTNLVAGGTDTNGTLDLFVFERATGVVKLVSHSSSSLTTAANAAHGNSSGASLSADGAFIAFESGASNLVVGQKTSGSTYDVFLYERATGLVSMISHVPAESDRAGDQGSNAPSISGDGSVVVFRSDATNLVTGQSDTNGVGDVFLYRRATLGVSLVSRTPASPTTTANGSSFGTEVSQDGSTVLFGSVATNLTTGQSDANGTGDLFLFDPASGSMILVSHTAASATTTANAQSVSPSLSANGGWVAFMSAATNLALGQSDANAGDDVFVFERATGTVTLVSHLAGNVAGAAGGTTTSNAISADGGFVGFTSNSANLVVGQSDANGASDAFLFRRRGELTPPADFSGNGVAQFSVFRPSTGVWFTGGGFTPFGTTGDIPVPGDYDSDGDDNVAVFRPSNGLWFDYDADDPPQPFGTAGDIPVRMEVDEGTGTPAVFRPSNGYWFVKPGITVQYGADGDIPVPGYYTGEDEQTEVAVFRPSNGYWFIRNGPIVQFGTAGDIPVPGDYDGDGDTDIAVFRPSNGYWFVHGGAIVPFGTTGDIPVPGDYDGDGDTDIAVFRPSNGYWFVNGGPIVAYGTSGDVPLPLPDAIRRFFFPPL